ncbi:hypothetical protein [Dyella nitratireducens]|uniref:DUF8082 domain-containing protein n=1 Tax=Dyella nitratireducens TaxID=1849580 RepID=A0ABQ1G8S6_9GAMM|nr:hypothetical protein [Dyella nitratireducens]GGA38982.1 hypothetical protein GCM10010981_30300 [Dyella nitratireducens]GLQ40387.1 hypothetical protein GCM10007902_02360 [Dyella nitratireducens]
MVTEFRPLIEVLRELQRLVQKKVSGHFFIATESNHSSMILLRNGQVDEVTFSRYRSDEAVKQLAGVSAARARFQPGKFDASAGRTPLGEAALQWLLGGFESDKAVQQRVAPAAAPSAPPKTDAEASREIVEKVTLTYLGPIGTLICDEAFSSSGNMDQVLEQIGSNLSTPEEIRRFMEEVRSALARG